MWLEGHIDAHLAYLAQGRDRTTDPRERLVGILEAYALIAHDSHRHRDSELAVILHRDEHIARREHQLHDMLRDLLSETVRVGMVRADISPGELASYCIHALARREPCLPKRPSAVSSKSPSHRSSLREHNDTQHRHGSWWQRIRHALGAHSHDPGAGVDQALETSAQGIRALKISLIGLAVTALLQSIVVVVTGSVALLGDTLHNFADALTSVPLWIAFKVGRRPRTARHTYGFGKAEDIAGLFIILAIASSAIVAGYETVRRLIEPQELNSIGLVIAAGLIGFAGNELVAVYRIRVGRQIGLSRARCRRHAFAYRWPHVSRGCGRRRWRRCRIRRCRPNRRSRHDDCSVVRSKGSDEGHLSPADGRS